MEDDSGQIGLKRPADMPWLFRIWRRLAGDRNQTVQEMIIEFVNERARREDGELDRKLALLDEVRKP